MTHLGIYSVHSSYTRLSDHQNREKISRDRIISTQETTKKLQRNYQVYGYLRTIVPQPEGVTRPDIISTFFFYFEKKNTKGRLF